MTLDPNVSVCERCKAVGTIVDMKLCCKVATWNRQFTISERFRALPPTTRPYTWRPK